MLQNLFQPNSELSLKAFKQDCLISEWPVNVSKYSGLYKSLQQYIQHCLWHIIQILGQSTPSTEVERPIQVYSNSKSIFSALAFYICQYILTFIFWHSEFRMQYNLRSAKITFQIYRYSITELFCTPHTAVVAFPLITLNQTIGNSTKDYRSLQAQEDNAQQLELHQEPKPIQTGKHLAWKSVHIRRTKLILCCLEQQTGQAGAKVFNAVLNFE